MSPPPRLLDDADVLAYAAVPASARFTGRLRLYSGDKRVGSVPNLAICKLHRDSSLLLLHCDDSWNIIGLQGWNTSNYEFVATVESVKQQTERYYEGLVESWKEVPGVA